MSMTYASLIAEVTDYLNRTDADTIARIPDFISQAQQRVARESKTLGIESYVVSAFITGQSVYQKPGGWRRTLSINFGNGIGNNTRNFLQLSAYEFATSYWPNPTLTSPPKFYSDKGYSNFLIAPTPDSNYPFELCYLELIAPLSNSNQTNWWTNYAPDVLLYASLLEAVPFLKDDDRIPVWEKYYDRALQSLNVQDDQRVVDRATNRSSD